MAQPNLKPIVNEDQPTEKRLDWMSMEEITGRPCAKPKGLIAPFFPNATTPDTSFGTLKSWLNQLRKKRVKKA